MIKRFNDPDMQARYDRAVQEIAKLVVEQTRDYVRGCDQNDGRDTAGDNDYLGDQLCNLMEETDVTDDVLTAGLCILQPERCPGCGCRPGDGVNEDCMHPDGCGHWYEVRKADPMTQVHDRR